jgi:hypothetical protein
MKSWDARIFKQPIVRAEGSFGTHIVEGAFFAEPREVEVTGGAVMGVAISFECQYDARLAELAEGDDFTVDSYGTFRFLRELLPGGDESGLTIIELGSKR